MWKTSAAACFLAGRLLAQAPAQPDGWIPDPRQWRLELPDPLGGWMTQAPEGLRVRLVDPTAPKPPSEAPYDPEEDWEQRYQRRREKLKAEVRFQLETDAERPPQALVLFETWWKEPWNPQIQGNPLAWAALIRAQRRADEARQKRREALRADLLVWFNGQRTTHSLVLNEPSHLYVDAVEGENRLELLEPRSGQAVVRTWWGSGRPARLRIFTEEASQNGSSGQLQVLEPSGKFRKSGEGYAWTHPAAGTYTLRWNQPRWTWDWRSYRDEDPDPPRQVRVVVILDGGGDRERRWQFEAVALPGSGAITLGSFDVETD